MNKELQCLSNKIVIFKTNDGKISVDVNFDMDTAWLSLDQIAELFGRDKSTISRHIKNLFEEGELQRDSVVAKFATTATDEKANPEWRDLSLDFLDSATTRRMTR